MMHALGYFLISIAKVLSLLINLYTFIIAGSVVVSWVGADPYNPIVRFLRQATEPVFWRVRRFMPGFLKRSSIDFTPVLVLILLIFIETLGGGLLAEWGQALLRK